MTDRVLKKLRVALEDGDFYGAHQMYLTVCNRYVKARKIDQAVELLTNGTRLLCERKQYGSAQDMASVILKTWTDEEVEVHDDNLYQLLEILDMFDPKAKEYGEIVKAGLKWTSKCGDVETGDPAFHHHVGITYASVDKLEEAQRHLFMGTVASAESLAVVLLKRGMSENLETERLANMVLNPTLQYLSSVRIAHALAFFKSYVQHLESVHESIKGSAIATPVSSTNHLEVYKVPVLNFVHLVLLTSQRGPAAAQGYMALCSQYLSQMEESDPIQELLERVGEKIFNIQPRRAQPNVLQDLMSSLLGGLQQ